MKRSTDSTSPLSFGLSARGHRAADQPISYLMAEALRRPGLISLAAGFVDNDTLPADIMRQLTERVLGDPDSARAALQYGTTPGYPPLREALYDHMARLDGIAPDAFPGSADQVVVSTGSQQLLHILTDMLVDPGDIVVTCWPTYFVYTGVLTEFGAQVRGVAIDDRGIDPDRLEAAFEQLERDGQLDRVKIVYLCPYHQNPTGLTLSADRRAPVLELVRRYSAKAGHRILLIEDAAYRELTYEDQAPGSIKQHDTGNTTVALLQTFSKPFAPGIKTGYGLLPGDLVESALLAKGGRDFGSANLQQHLMNQAMRTGLYDRQVRRVCAAYAAKRDAMLAALDEHLGDVPGVTWTRPTGGLYVWLTLPETIDTSRHGRLFRDALDAGMLFVPGAYCYPPDMTQTAPNHTIRLSFGVPPVDQIRQGIAHLATAIHRYPKDAAAS